VAPRSGARRVARCGAQSATHLEHGSRDQGYRSRCSLNPWLPSLHRSAVPHRHFFMIRTVIFTLLTAIPVFGQSTVSIEVSAHAGVPLNHTLEQAFCCTTGVGFIHYEPDDASYLAGLSAGVVLRDRIHISFGAMYMPVSFKSVGTSCCPLSHPEARVHGTSWEFPLLADYRWLHGSLRPFSGGGVVLHNRTTGGSNQSPAPVISGGLEWINGRFALRPEFRYIHYPREPGSDVAVGRPATQLQLMVGFTYRR
jgi:hypothetical protein